MIVLTAYVSLLPNRIESALDACRTVREHSVKEPGCDRYDFFQSPDDPTKLVFVEEWTSKAALDLHFEQDAFKQFFASMGELMVGPPDLRIFESSRLG